MGRIRKFCFLPVVEKVIFFRAWFLLVLSRWLLQFKQFESVVAYFSCKAAGPQIAVIHVIPPARVAELLGAAASIVPFSTCLSRSLAGLVLFRLLGYKVLLHVGVTREDGRGVEAHAWLSLDGAVMIGYRSDLDRYQEMPFIF